MGVQHDYLWGFFKYDFNTILLYINVNFDIQPIVTSCFKVWQVHNPSVYGVFVVATSAARAAELLVAQCPVSLITRPMLPGALTTHNLVAYHLPSSILWRLRHYQLTGWRCHTNDSCWWSYEPAPFFDWNSSFMYPPTGLFGFHLSRVHKFWSTRAKVSGFSLSSQQLSTPSDVKRVGRP